jgi:hypothetical protein
MIEVFEIYRDDRSKKALKALQAEYMKHDKDWKQNCMCNSVTRKVSHRKFYEWYDNR